MTEAATPGERFCVECGAPRSGVFCAQCGASGTAVRDVDPWAGSTSPPAPTPRGPAWQLVAVVALLLVGAGIFLLTRDGAPGDDARVASPGPSASASGSASPSSVVELGLRPGEEDAVRQRAELLFSYDHRMLDAQEERAQAVTAGAAEEEYLRTFRTVVRDIATTNEATVDADAVEVAVRSRAPGSRTFLVFVNQSTTSNRAEGPRQDPSSALLTLDDQDLVTALRVVDPASPPPAATGEAARLEGEVLATMRPVFEIDVANIDADLQRVQDNATGTYGADFGDRVQGLRQTLVDNDVSSAVVGTPVLGIEGVDGDSVRVLLVLEASVANKANPAGGLNRYRAAATLVRVDGRLLLSELDFIA